MKSISLSSTNVRSSSKALTARSSFMLVDLFAAVCLRYRASRRARREPHPGKSGRVDRDGLTLQLDPWSCKQQAEALRIRKFASQFSRSSFNTRLLARYGACVGQVSKKDRVKLAFTATRLLELHLELVASSVESCSLAIMRARMTQVEASS